MQKFLISQTTVSLNESQGHLNWHEKVEFSYFYHRTKFEEIGLYMISIQQQRRRGGGDCFVLFFYEITSVGFSSLSTD